MFTLCTLLAGSVSLYIIHINSPSGASIKNINWNGIRRIPMMTGRQVFIDINERGYFIFVTYTSFWNKRIAFLAICTHTELRVHTRFHLSPAGQPFSCHIIIRAFWQSALWLTAENPTRPVSVFCGLFCGLSLHWQHMTLKSGRYIVRFLMSCVKTFTSHPDGYSHTSGCDVKVLLHVCALFLISWVLGS